MKNVLLAISLAFFGVSLFGQTVPTPTQTDELIIDNTVPGKADPGDRIRYKVTVTNTAGPNATNVQLNVTNPPDMAGLTTLVGGSFRTSPLALPDGPYACIGNVGINVPAANGLLSNDFDDNPAGLVITTVTNAATTSGGQITIAADGGFSYTPAAGFEGTDTYTYTLNDGNGVGGGVPATDAGVVSITVNEVIWFIDASASPGGNGRLETPWNNINSFNATSLDDPGDIIFFYTGTYNATGVLAMLGQQKLVGQGATATLATVTGITVPTHSKALPATNGTRPTLSRAGDVVNAQGQNLVRGLNITNTAGTGLFGSGFTSLTASEVSVTASNGAAAVSFNNGALTVTLTSVSSTSCTNGISLTNCSGNMTVEGGTLTNSTAADALVSGGSVNFTFSGSISDNSGFAVDIDNHDSGNVTFQTGNITSTGSGIRVQNCGGGTKAFSGNITTTAGTAITASSNNGGIINFSGSSKNLSSGANIAVNLTSNTGATVNFTNGGLVISTSSGTGFNATGGGTVTVQGAGNTISSTSGTALNVTSTTIGASNLNFQSISSGNNTVATDPANGIVLNTTGSSGSLIVTGNSNTSVGGDNSGGEIQNTTSHGISLNSTLSPSFTNMNIHDTGGSGISGTLVTNFTFNYGKVDNSGNAVGEANITFNGNGTNLGNNLSGTVNVINNQLTDAFDSGFEVQSSDGTISELTITGNSIISPTSTASSKGSGIKLVFIGTASTVANLTKATISNNTISNFPSDAGIEVKGGNTVATGTGGVLGTPGSPTNIISITNNQISGQSSANKMGTDFMDIGLSGGNSGSRSQGNFNISNNGTVGSPMSHCAGIGIGFGNTGYATMTMTIHNNYLSLNNTVASAGIGGGNGIVTSTAETPDLTITVTNNTVTNCDGNGILVVSRGVTGLAKIGIRNNNIAAPLTGVRPGIRVDAGNATSVDDVVCVDISGNTSGGSGGHPGIGIRKQGTNPTVNDFGIEGFGGGTCSQAEDFIAGLNPGSVLGTLSFCGGPKRVGGLSGDNYVSCNTAP